MFEVFGKFEVVVFLLMVMDLILLWKLFYVVFIMSFFFSGLLVWDRNYLNCFVMWGVFSLGYFRFLVGNELWCGKGRFSIGYFYVCDFCEKGLSWWKLVIVNRLICLKLKCYVFFVYVCCMEKKWVDCG